MLSFGYRNFMEKNLENLVKRVAYKFDPVSIFLYGSRAKGDFLEKSDYEIGVLYHDNKKILPEKLREESKKWKNIFLYPFEYEKFINFHIDTPFPENIYFRDLSETGKTLCGEKVVEKMNPPQITTLDLLQRVRFDTGLALAAVLSQRNGDETTAKEEFTKSCLFGVRCLIILKEKKFPLSYEEIYHLSQDLNLEKQQKIIDHAMEVRKGAEIKEDFLYQNISLLNKTIKNFIWESFQKEGNKFCV